MSHNNFSMGVFPIVRLKNKASNLADGTYFSVGNSSSNRPNLQCNKHQTELLKCKMYNSYKLCWTRCPFLVFKTSTNENISNGWMQSERKHSPCFAKIRLSKHVLRHKTDPLFRSAVFGPQYHLIGFNGCYNRLR